MLDEAGARVDHTWVNLRSPEAADCVGPAACSGRFLDGLGDPADLSGYDPGYPIQGWVPGCLYMHPGGIQAGGCEDSNLYSVCGCYGTVQRYVYCFFSKN